MALLYIYKCKARSLTKTLSKLDGSLGCLYESHRNVKKIKITDIISRTAKATVTKMVFLESAEQILGNNSNDFSKFEKNLNFQLSRSNFFKQSYREKKNSNFLPNLENHYYCFLEFVPLILEIPFLSQPFLR